MAKLIIPLKTGNHFYFQKKRRPGIKGWTIDDVVPVLIYITKHYRSVGVRKPEFTREEVAYLIGWLLYKKKFVHEALEVDPDGRDPGIKSPREFRKLTFVNNLIETMGNGAEAARRTGYSAKRAKQTAFDLLHPRKRF